jgi:hypothetical protein
MDSSMLPRTLVAVALCALAMLLLPVAAVAAAGAEPAMTPETADGGSITVADVSQRPATGGATRYEDATGDADSTIDVDAVTVGNDVDDVVTFSISMPDHDYFSPGETLSIYLDVDQDAASGSFGAEYLLEVRGDDNTIGLARWDGSGWDFHTAQSTLRATAWLGATISLASSEFGSPSEFDFSVLASRGSSTDAAPQEGSFTYRLSAPVTLQSVTAEPAASGSADPGAANSRGPAIDDSLSVRDGLRVAQSYIARRLHGFPRYTRVACSGAQSTIVACRFAFTRRAYSYRGRATIESFVNGTTLQRYVVFTGTRTDQACVRRLARQGRSARRCTETVII